MSAGALVVNLDNGDKYLYSVLPEKAVVNAWYQSKGDYDWWTYDYSLAQYSESGKTVHCGSFVAMTGK